MKGTLRAQCTPGSAAVAESQFCKFLLRKLLKKLVRIRVSAICDELKAPHSKYSEMQSGMGGGLGFEPRASLCWSSVLLLSFSSSPCKAF